MRRRAATDEDSSMELFLSTSCDSFGGIVFITLMICLLPSKSNEGSSAAGLDAGPAELALLEKEKSDLSRKERIFDVLARTEVGLGSTEDASRLNELFRLESEERELQHAAVARGKELSQLEPDVKRMERDRDFLTASLEQLKTGLLKAEQERTSKEEVRETRLPRLHKLSKRNYFLVLQYGKIFETQRPGADGLGGDNDTDFVLTRAGRATQYEAKPDGGTDAAAWLSNATGARALKRCLSVREYIINIVVYPDSLSVFNGVRNSFTGARYDYIWIPLSSGKNLILGPAKGPQDAL